MTALTTVDVRALIASRPLGRLQKLVVFLGFCIITLDGFDLGVMGFVVPVLKQQWNVSNQALGPALSAAQIGLVVGAVSAGPIADRFGRKVTLLISTAVFGLCTLLTASAGDLTSLAVFRLLTGLGIGSVVPNTATLISEYVPERMRSLSVSFLICGVAFSSAVAGFLSAWVLPSFGWQSIFLIGGLITLAMIPILAIWLPESARFLAANGAPSARIHAIIDRLAPGETSAESVFVASAEPHDTSGATRLVLSAPYRFGSLMLWLGYFAALFASNLVSNWLPTLIKESGFSLSYAAIVAAVYQLGGVAGALFMGWAMDRRDMHKVPSAAYFASGVLFLGFGLGLHSTSLTLVQAFGLGFCLVGAICGVNALPTAFYPTKARATGACWMHGAGRSGALVSIFTGAQLLTIGWDATWVLMSLFVPSVIAGIAIIAKQKYARPAGVPIGAVR